MRAGLTTAPPVHARSRRLTHNHGRSSLARAAGHLHQVTELRNANAELEELAKMYDDQKIAMKEEIVKLKKDNKKLLGERPKYYMKVKGGIKGCASTVCTIQ